MHASILGVGSYLPRKILTNHDLENLVETSDEWITSRSGIKKRHIAEEGELTSDLAVEASKKALAHANLSPSDIDLIIVATTTPDCTFPSTAAIVQKKLNIPPCPAFDIQAVCSGFLYAFNTADLYIRAGQAKRVLLIGAETMSRILNWEDRTTCVLFGDGAGAMVLGATDNPKVGIKACKLYADGHHCQGLYTTGGVSQKTVGTIVMHGAEVFKFAVESMAKVSEEVLALAGVNITDIDWVIPHQANQRILIALAERLSLPMEKVISTVADHANTSAATISLAFDAAIQEGKLKREHKILVPAMGAGFTWGALYLRY